MSDELDDLIDRIGKLAERGPDPIDAALTTMSVRLAEQGENHLHSLLHCDLNSLYVGLANSRDGLIEVSGQGYSRQQFNQATQNLVKFPEAQSGWGTIEAVVFFSGNTPVVTLPLDVSRNLLAGESLHVQVNLIFP